MLLVLIAALLATPPRIVSLSKQVTEIVYALGAENELVGADLSSTYPPAAAALPKVGYHRALGVEGILSLNPTLILHDNNIGPEQVVRQLHDLKIPMKAFDAKAEDLPSTEALIAEMGAYFHKEERAKALNARLRSDMEKALSFRATKKPRVLVIHFGRAMNVYLAMTNAGVAGKMIEWAGGEMAARGDRAMVQLSPEVVAAADPDLLLLTDYGYDRLGSTAEVIKALPGVAATRAARTGRIARVEEHDLAYLGPRTGENVLALQKLIHAPAAR